MPLISKQSRFLIKPIYLAKFLVYIKLNWVFKGFYTLDIFAHNILIKNIFFSSKYCSDISKDFQTGINRIELSKNIYFQYTQEKYIGWKMSFYCNIFLSFYQNIVCQNV